MEDIEAYEIIHTEIETGIQLPKCQQCGCMRGALDAFVQRLPSIIGKEAGFLAEQAVGWVGKMKEVRYTCLGCEHCYPAVAENAFALAFPEADLPPTLACDFHASSGVWPVVLGEYFVLDKTAPVAVSTLTSVHLAEELAERKPPGLAIVGKTETENIGIDKIVKNVIANPSIQFLVIAGNESRGHQSGSTLVALAQNGVDENGRVVDAAGKRPVLRNVTWEEIEAFREQVQVVDLRGCTDPDEIGVRVAQLAAETAISCSCHEVVNESVDLITPIALTVPITTMTPDDCSDPHCGCHSQSQAVPQILIAPEFKQNIPLDRAGYFVILPVTDRDVINVEYYSYDNSLQHIIEGPNARALYLAIISEGWVTELSHAAYLGKELAKAELALKYGFKYVQDGA